MNDELYKARTERINDFLRVKPKFESMLKRRGDNKKKFCERNNINYGYFRVAYCNKFVKTNKLFLLVKAYAEDESKHDV